MIATLQRKPLGQLLLVKGLIKPEQLERVRQKVSIAIGRNAIVHQYVDESIIGGLVLRVQDKLIDASVKHQLEMMRRQLLQATPK